MPDNMTISATPSLASSVCSLRAAALSSLVDTVIPSNRSTSGSSAWTAGPRSRDDLVRDHRGCRPESGLLVSGRLRRNPNQNENVEYKAQTKQPKRKRQSKRDVYRAPSPEFLQTMVVKGWRATPLPVPAPRRDYVVGFWVGCLWEPVSLLECRSRYFAEAVYSLADRDFRARGRSGLVRLVPRLRR